MSLFVATLLYGLLGAQFDTCLRAEPVTVTRPGGYLLSGIIEFAGERSTRPTVLLIGGAGPTDRDAYTLSGSDGHNGAFALISARLVAAGYAVVRFDEVGTGRSSGDYASTATTRSLASDARAVLDAARETTVVDRDRTFILGYSEGAVIAGILAASDTSVAGVVLLAAPAWTGSRIMAFQDSVTVARRALDGASPTDAAVSLQRRSAERAASDLWYREFLDFNPLLAIDRMTAPTLLVHGAEDTRVSPEQAVELAGAFIKNGNDDIELHILPAHGHSLTDADSRQVLAPLSPIVLRTIVSWLQARVPSTVGFAGCVR